MATPEEIRRWVESTRPKDWYGICAGLTWQTIYYNGGDSGVPFPSAWSAYLSARDAGMIESRDWTTAPAGAIHYWDYYGTDAYGNRGHWGHVAVDIYGGGHNILSATGHAHEEWGVHAGLISVPAQTARGMEYVGWARTYGAGQRITIETTAGGGAEPLPEPECEDDDMNGFYYGNNDDKGQPFYFFNEARGKSRVVSNEEWNMRRALQRGALPNVPVEVHLLSNFWYQKTLALGTYTPA
jgi:hypothetical protein